jgi:hypothetical protein
VTHSFRQFTKRYALLLARHPGLAAEMTPAVSAYRERLEQRPGYQRAQAAQWAAAREQGVPLVAAPDTRP